VKELGIILVVVVALAAIVLVGALVWQVAWNACIPHVWGLPTLSYAQAMGMVVMICMLTSGSVYGRSRK